MVYFPQLYERTPYGCTVDPNETDLRRWGLIPKSARGCNSWRIWICRCRRKPKCFPLFNSVNAVRLRHLVSCLNARPLSSRRCVKASRQDRKPSTKNRFTGILNTSALRASSGASSPQSSVTSIIFSSSSSSSSRSPPSSQNSFTDNTPFPSVLVRRQPRIQVSSLLADSFTRTYHLEVIQHPLRTAEFGQASLSRLPLTPPLIAQLIVRDPSGNSVFPEAELPFLIAHLSLFSGDGLTALDMGSSIGHVHSSPILYGNLVSSVDQLEDLQGNMGLFFIFPDVSIRWRGRFQLGVTAVRISRSDSSGSMSIADHGTVLAEARTRPFDVLPQNQYSAVAPTRLTQCFLRQGARMFTFMSRNG